MRSDVKTLIGALKTERDALTRAIASLEAISPAATPSPTRTRTTVRRKAKTHLAVPPEVKRLAVDVMTAAPAGELGTTAHRFARQHGLNGVTVQGSWRRWKQELALESLAAVGMRDEMEAVSA